MLSFIKRGYISFKGFFPYGLISVTAVYDPADRHFKRVASILVLPPILLLGKGIDAVDLGVPDELGSKP